MKNGAAGTYAQADFSGYKTSTCFEPDGLLQAQVSLQLHHDHRSTLLPGCDTGRSFNGPLQGRLRRPRAHVASIDGPRHLTHSGRSHYAAHPYNSGRCHRLGLPALLGWPQSRDPAPRRDGRAMVGIGLGYLLASEVSDAAVALAVGVISIAFRDARLRGRRGGGRAPNKPGVG